jgi:hypothetical protein
MTAASAIDALAEIAPNRTESMDPVIGAFLQAEKAS